MKPSALKRVLPTLLELRRPVFIWGKSGAGKSAVIKQFAAEAGLELRDMRLSQLESIDLRGFPMPDAKKRITDWLPPADLPRQGDKPGILFLDECNGAQPDVQSAAYQLINDFRIGSYEFPDNWGIIAAGNNVEDRGVTHAMAAPLNNRFLHIDFEVDASDWAIQAHKDDRSLELRSYMKLKGESALHVFDSALNPRCFPTPRTWYMADDIFQNAALTPADKAELICGTVGEGAGREFLGFVKELEAMVDVDTVLLNPEKAKLPGNQPVMHAVAQALVDRATPANFDRIMIYVNRLQREIQAVFLRSATEHDGRVVNTKGYQSWMIKNQDVLL